MDTLTAAAGSLALALAAAGVYLTGSWFGPGWACAAGIIWALGVVLLYRHARRRHPRPDREG